jgi:hypothetical protein
MATRFKARATEAGEKIEILGALLEKTPDNEWNSRSAVHARCQVMLELAYASFVTGEEIVHKSDKQFEYFHVALGGGEELFDMVYVYSLSGGFISSRIDSLPKGWKSVFLESGKVLIVLPGDTEDRCMFEFDLVDPFAAKVVAE